MTFRFDDITYHGYEGDSLASALLANGVTVMGRSFKYHRPRGLLGAGSEEPNALVVLGEGGRATPDLRATQIELFDGLVARSQNRWPSLNYDIGAVNSWLSRLIPAGFYYKTFMWPRAAWHKLYEPIIRKSAGLGVAASEPDPDSYDQIHDFCDVLIAGGGIAGLSAALAAAEAGARVILMDEQPVLGGRSADDGLEIDNKDVGVWVRAITRKLQSKPNVRILTRTTLTGHYDHNFAMALERITDHLPPTASGTTRQRLWRIRAKQIIVAAGAIERPLTFANNDRPGVMLASAVRTYLHQYGVSPGHRIVLFTNNDDAYRTALALSKAGITVPCVIDVRPKSEGDLVRKAQERGIRVVFNTVIAQVTGKPNVQSITIGPRRDTGRIGDPLEKIHCDAIAMSGGWNPAVHLFSHCGGKLKFDDDLAAFVPDQTREQMRICGAANGSFNPLDVIREGQETGLAAACDALSKKIKANHRTPNIEAVSEDPMLPFWFAPSIPPYTEGNKHFVDFQHDVTAADVELAAREGYQSVEHTKRFTTLGMATDQGKTSNINGLALLGDALNKPIPEVGTTTFRPPYTALTFGAITGHNTGKLFHPVRHTPISNWSNAHGADNEPVGDWRRPFCYRKDGEDREAAVHREVMAVRNSAGLLDASTLGKIEVRGPDAGILLDRIYTNMMSNLKPGRCRYGLMLDDNGFLWDDGVVVAMSENHYLLHTTSGNAARVRAWLEEWVQTEWWDLKVYITDVTEQWAQFAVAGPKARKIIETLESDMDWSRDAFPFMDYRAGSLSGTQIRAYRISFSGELSYEIAIPASQGLNLWTALMRAGEAYDLTPYGTEALHILRAEKGYIMIGDETDGTVTPEDLGLNWALSKKKDDYLGKRALQRPFLADQDNRHRLVGLMTDDPEVVLPSGAYAVDKVTSRPPMKTIGHVTSSYMSPTLGRSIAMALVKNGPERMGDTLQFPLPSGVVAAKIVDPVFYDKDGERQNVE